MFSHQDTKINMKLTKIPNNNYQITNKIQISNSKNSPVDILSAFVSFPEGIPSEVAKKL
jgi:hypothetical protein